MSRRKVVPHRRQPGRRPLARRALVVLAFLGLAVGAYLVTQWIRTDTLARTVTPG